MLKSKRLGLGRSSRNWPMLLTCVVACVFLLLSWSSCSSVAAVELDFDTHIPGHDGLANLKEGQRLLVERNYDKAAFHFWRAVLVQEQNKGKYSTEEAFRPFIQCFTAQDRVVDAFIFVSQESFGRGQYDMAKAYAGQALQVEPNNSEGLMIFSQLDSMGKLTAAEQKILQQYLEKTDGVDQNIGDEENVEVEDKYDRMTPEQLYELGAQKFSDREYEDCADFFELSCQKSKLKLGPSCANAVYCRNMILDWGFNGTQFDEDMHRVAQITRKEAHARRSVNSEGIFQWDRDTSVHPHMMLSYPIDELMLKRYVAESTAFMDEKLARVDPKTMQLVPLPNGLPYDMEKERPGFLANAADTNFKIKIGFVASGFNSKAVLYLSHDMFRFFDKSKFEVHIFSVGPPDNPIFIEHGMRGVDWRERVMANADHFHDMQSLKDDHVALARFIHELKINILIEWDGYARQGERAQGLFALRPAPVQILHQEYLGTSGAQYVDYIFTDATVSPLRLDKFYTEKFIYMPNHFFSKGHAVQKEVRAPTIEYSPVQKPYELGTGSPRANRCMAPPGQGPETPSIVYCNFNKFLKNNPQTVRSWIRILREVPGSMICLLENPGAGVKYLRKFIHETAGTSSGNNDESTMEPGDGDDLVSRIHFLPWQKNPFDHQMRNMDFCNVMLDSWPYNGHTVAQDALYGGVPIVTRSDGDEMASLVTTSSNKVLGLEELNAYDGPTHYEDIAISLGTDSAKLEQIRSKLIGTALQRNPMHPYWDVPRYVKNFETGLSMAWDRYKAGLAPDHLMIEESEDAKRGTYDEVLLANPQDKEKIQTYASEEL